MKLCSPDSAAPAGAAPAAAPAAFAAGAVGGATAGSEGWGTLAGTGTVHHTGFPAAGWKMRPLGAGGESVDADWVPPDEGGRDPAAPRLPCRLVKLEEPALEFTTIGGAPPKMPAPNEVAA